MSESDPLDEVSEILGLAIEVIDSAVGDLKSSAEVALADETFEVLHDVTRRMETLREFQTAVDGLVVRWAEIQGQPLPSGETTAGLVERTYLGRVERGSRTAEPAFRVPILTALADAGGSLPVHDALDRVGDLMASTLNDVDRETLPSDDRLIRWRNTARWARNALADAGFIDRSKRGVWSITPEGRAWLEKHR